MRVRRGFCQCSSALEQPRPGRGSSLSIHLLITRGSLPLGVSFAVCWPCPGNLVHFSQTLLCSLHIIHCLYFQAFIFKPCVNHVVTGI